MIRHSTNAGTFQGGTSCKPTGAKNVFWLDTRIPSRTCWARHLVKMLFISTAVPRAVLLTPWEAKRRQTCVCLLPLCVLRMHVAIQGSGKYYGIIDLCFSFSTSRLTSNIWRPLKSKMLRELSLFHTRVSAIFAAVLSLQGCEMLQQQLNKNKRTK